MLARAHVHIYACCEFLVCMQVIAIEFGFGVDMHGQDATVCVSNRKFFEMLYRAWHAHVHGTILMTLKGCLVADSSSQGSKECIGEDQHSCSPGVCPRGF